MKTLNIKANQELNALIEGNTYLFVHDRLCFRYPVSLDDIVVKTIIDREIKLPKDWTIVDGQQVYQLLETDDLSESLKVILLIRIEGLELIDKLKLPVIKDSSTLEAAEKDVFDTYWGKTILQEGEEWEDLSPEEADLRRQEWHENRKALSRQKTLYVGTYYDEVINTVGESRLDWLRLFHNYVVQHILLMEDIYNRRYLDRQDRIVYTTIRGLVPEGVVVDIRYATLLELILRKYEYNIKLETIKAWLAVHPDCGEYFSKLDFPPDLPPYEVATPREVYKYWKDKRL